MNIPSTEFLEKMSVLEYVNFLKDKIEVLEAEQSNLKEAVKKFINYALEDVVKNLNDALSFL